MFCLKIKENTTGNTIVYHGPLIEIEKNDTVESCLKVVLKKKKKCYKPKLSIFIHRIVTEHIGGTTILLKNVKFPEIFVKCKKKKSSFFYRSIKLIQAIEKKSKAPFKEGKRSRLQCIIDIVTLRIIRS